MFLNTPFPWKKKTAKDYPLAVILPLFVRCSWRCRRRLSVVYWGCLFYNGGMSLNLAPTFANLCAVFWICGILPHVVPALCPCFAGCSCVRLFHLLTAC